MSDEQDLDLTDDLEEMEPESFDNDGEIVNVQSCTSQELCNFVIAFRYLGVFRPRAVEAMKELAARHQNGDAFDFETYIQEEFSKLPKLNFNLSSSFNFPIQSFLGKK